MTRAFGIVFAFFLATPGAWGARPIYQLADQRTNTEAAPDRLNKLIVVGISDDREVRNRFEDKFTTHLRGREIAAIASHSLVPDLKQPGDRERILQALAQEGVDGAMTIRAVPLDDTDEEVWGRAWTAWIDAPSTVRDLVEKTIPVPKKKAKRYGIELALWDLEAARPLWAARTRPVLLRDLRAGTGDLLQLTIESLKDTPWLARDGNRP